MQDKDEKLPKPVGGQPENVPVIAPNDPHGNVVPTWFAQQPTPGVQPDATKPKKNGKLIASIIAIALLVLVGGAVAAYNLWYQNPEKVVTDSILNAVKAKSIKYSGSLTVTGDSAVKIEVTGRGAGVTNALSGKMTFDIEDKPVTLEGSGLIDSKGDLYFKVKSIDSLVSQYREWMTTEESKKLFNDILAKVNDKWIKVGADDLKSVNESTGDSQKCLTDAAKKLQDDKALSDELGQAYKSNRFITIDEKLGSKDGSLGYVLGYDETAAKSFVKDLKNTKIYKTLKDCDDSFTINEDDLFKNDDDTKTEDRVELWVSRFSHEVTKLNVDTKSDDSKATLVFEPVFNQEIDAINAPEKSTTIKQIQEDITSIFESAFSMSAYDDSYYVEDSLTTEL